jgi:thioredoxin 1
LAALLEKYPDVHHLRIEDGPGRPLGRSFDVKLWPTFVGLYKGQVVRRLVRPSPQALTQAMADLNDAGSSPDR